MKAILFLLFSFCVLQANAQKLIVVSLPIHGTPTDFNFSDDVFFTIKKPKGVEFRSGQTFICKGVYKNNDNDTAQKAVGVIFKIFTDSIRCVINKKNMKTMPVEGDLCSFLVRGREERSADVFYKLARFAISFKSVQEEMIFDAFNSLGEWPESRSKAMLDELAKDIRYTGAEMLKQNDGQQQTVAGGDFNGKPLFTAMQQVTAKDVQNFLEYVWARPMKYSGTTWKISETFATWMISGTPKFVAIEEKN